MAKSPDADPYKVSAFLSLGLGLNNFASKRRFHCRAAKINQFRGVRRLRNGPFSVAKNKKKTTRNSSLKISATETNKKKTSRKSTNYNRGNGIRVVAQRTLFLPFCRRCCSCCFLLYDIFFWVPYKGRAADAKIQSDSATLRGGNSIGEEEKEAKAKEKEKRGALICMRLEGDLHTAPRPRTSYSVDRAT